ncbi:MAG: site-specific integrase, partial [Nostocoides sp.]|uniref:site-specific integrase n=1 Tax=Nostocoides sp. TaxID=1917966 RepID=UPI003C71EE42
MLPVSFQEALGDWLNHLDIERGLSRHTLRAYERDVTRYLAFLHGQGVAQLAAVDS